ncbi:FAD binding protein, partial [Aspergillus sp. HF37]
MKKVNVDPTTKTVTAQGGALWADVNKSAAQHSLAVVSGTFSQVGVGGLTLRGGYGYLTPQYGLALDNLISATVVVADGRILRAAREENADLFWVVQGAGPTIGVVAELVFQAHGQHDNVWNGMRTYPKEKLPEVIRALNEALVHPEGKAAAQCVFSLLPETKESIVITVLFFNGSEEEGRTHFSSLLQLECVSCTMKMKPYEDANVLLDQVAPPGGRKKLIGLPFIPPIRPEFASNMMQEVSRQLTTETDMAHSSIEIEFLDLSRVRRVPIASTSFPARNQTMNGAIILQWTDPNNDGKFLEWGNKIHAMCEEELRWAGHRPDSLVSNFLGFTQ